MTSPQFAALLSIVVSLLVPRLVFAGTLDEAPFRVVVPDGEWQIADSTARPMGGEVFLVATISHTNTLLKSVVIKTVLKQTTDSGLDELCAGIRDSFANPAVQKVSEKDTTFMGYKAKAFTYEVTQGGQATYNEATVFIADGKGWTIACIGRSDQKDAIKKIIGFYQKKAG
jgi:hypothetical protein